MARRVVQRYAASVTQRICVDRLPKSSPTELVTAPDERERCCVLTNGERCRRPTAFRLASVDGALDDYTYVCAQDRARLESELGPGYVVTPVETP